ncbi:HNH endonuclease [Brucella intermedia]|uniref:HNH endonuclease n=1 Tax=Brucella TaxID=234 RepID=UPI00158CE4FD|nr:MULTISPECIES: HNH endonuclease signature motif containing protein [Brucella]MCO7736415.1 HNH endonuclease [Brucella intermedia]WLF99088.1 HNH endonuclease signature motif containing protein [Brucella intermedia]
MASKLGAKYYNTGAACIHGHTAPRSTSDGKCTVCKWLQWEANRRKKGKKPFQPNWKKAEAQELGDKFFHGEPCPHGHSGMRWTHNGACVECTINAARKFQNTPEGIEARKQWRFDNPDKVREYNRNSKAKRKGAEGTHTAEDIRDILTRQKYKCVECGASVRKKSNRHVDHIMPIALGGTNWPFNLQVLCPSCNLSKHAKHPLEWAREKGRLV